MFENLWAIHTAADTDTDSNADIGSTQRYMTDEYIVPNRYRPNSLYEQYMGGPIISFIWGIAKCGHVLAVVLAGNHSGW